MDFLFVESFKCLIICSSSLECNNICMPKIPFSQFLDCVLF